MKQPLFEKKLVIFYLWVSAAFIILGNATHPNQMGPRLLNNLWHILFVLFFNYLLFEYVFPLLKKKKYIRFVLLVIGYLFLYSWGSYLWRNIGVALHTYIPLVTYPNIYHAVEDQMAYNMAAIFFFGICRHVYMYVQLIRSTQKLRIEKQEAELNYLKSQTNPHFLFNTLNNIYALAKDKSDLAPESIMRLSKILRFMLYETSGKYIAVEDELKIISDYIELERLRYDESLKVNFNYDVEDMKQSLPPLLLIPLVENAFKHGASESRGRPYIDVHLNVKNRQLFLVVINSDESPGSDATIKENIGLSNLRRQLELLYTDYSLEVHKNAREFNATLKINLSSHVAN
jgi:two-component system, LytTR family, sensor kinase